MAAVRPVKYESDLKNLPSILHSTVIISFTRVFLHNASEFDLALTETPVAPLTNMV